MLFTLLKNPFAGAGATVEGAGWLCFGAAPQKQGEDRAVVCLRGSEDQGPGVASLDGTEGGQSRASGFGQGSAQETVARDEGEFSFFSSLGFVGVTEWF